jgi:hypothetical protein
MIFLSPGSLRSKRIRPRFKDLSLYKKGILVAILERATGIENVRN